MTKKLSPYAKKRMRETNTPEKMTARIMDQMCGLDRLVARSQPWAGNKIFKAERLLVPVRTALQKLLDHTIDGGDTRSFDMLVCAVGHAKIRYLEIGGENNVAMPILEKADQALLRAHYRWQKGGTFGLDGPGRQEIADAIDLYEQVFLASSPNQMLEVEKTYLRWLQLQKKGKLAGAQVVLKRGQHHDQHNDQHNDQHIANC